MGRGLGHRHKLNDEVDLLSLAFNMPTRQTLRRLDRRQQHAKPIQYLDSDDEESRCKTINSSDAESSEDTDPAPGQRSASSSGRVSDLLSWTRNKCLKVRSPSQNRRLSSKKRRQQGKGQRLAGRSRSISTSNNSTSSQSSVKSEDRALRSTKASKLRSKHRKSNEPGISDELIPRKLSSNRDKSVPSSVAVRKYLATPGPFNQPIFPYQTAPDRGGHVNMWYHHPYPVANSFTQSSPAPAWQWLPIQTGAPYPAQNHRPVQSSAPTGTMAQICNLQEKLNYKRQQSLHAPLDKILESDIKGIQEEINRCLDLAMLGTGRRNYNFGRSSSSSASKSSTNELPETKQDSEGSSRESEKSSWSINVTETKKTHGQKVLKSHHHVCSGCDSVRSLSFHAMHPFEYGQRRVYNYCSNCLATNSVIDTMKLLHFCFGCGIVRSRAYQSANPMNMRIMQANYCIRCVTTLRSHEGIPDMSVIGVDADGSKPPETAFSDGDQSSRAISYDDHCPDSSIAARAGSNSTASARASSRQYDSESLRARSSARSSPAVGSTTIQQRRKRNLIGSKAEIEHLALDNEVSYRCSEQPPLMSPCSPQRSLGTAYRRSQRDDTSHLSSGANHLTNRANSSTEYQIPFVEDEHDMTSVSDEANHLSQEPCRLQPCCHSRSVEPQMCHDHCQSRGPIPLTEVFEVAEPTRDHRTCGSHECEMKGLAPKHPQTSDSGSKHRTAHTSKEERVQEHDCCQRDGKIHCEHKDATRGSQAGSSNSPGSLSSRGSGKNEENGTTCFSRFSAYRKPKQVDSPLLRVPKPKSPTGDENRRNPSGSSSQYQPPSVDSVMEDVPGQPLTDEDGHETFKYSRGAFAPSVNSTETEANWGGISGGFYDYNPSNKPYFSEDLRFYNSEDRFSYEGETKDQSDRGFPPRNQFPKSTSIFSSFGASTSDPGLVDPDLEPSFFGENYDHGYGAAGDNPYYTPREPLFLHLRDRFNRTGSNAATSGFASRPHSHPKPGVSSRNWYFPEPIIEEPSSRPSSPEPKTKLIGKYRFCRSLELSPLTVLCSLEYSSSEEVDPPEVSDIKILANDERSKDIV